MSDNTLADLIAKRFIARRDVKAIQYPNGVWTPHTVTGKPDGERIPWSRKDLNAHIAGEKTFGHYLLNTDSTCKLFAFDVDLEKTGHLPSALKEDLAFYACNNLREAWLDRAHPARWWMKTQFKAMAHMLLKAIWEELELPCAAAYSGGKGIHVYGFTGPISAVEAREGAQIVLDALGCFEATRGTNFFKHKDTDPFLGFPNLSIETFPKQGSLDGKDLGNLMRLPLGRNLKSTDPTFFIDMTTPLALLAPVDPVFALTTDNPWKRADE